MSKTTDVADLWGPTLITLPIPSDSVKEPSDMWDTHILKIMPMTEFYQTYMRRHGWTFEPNYTTLDPNVAVSKHLGYATIQIWCEPGPPITTVIIQVAGGTNTDQGQYTRFSFAANQTEDSCP